MLFMAYLTGRILELIYGIDAKRYLTKRKNKGNWDYRNCEFIVFSLLIIFVFGLLGLFLVIIFSGTEDEWLAFLCLGVPVISFVVWAFVARKKRREHPELEPDADISASEVSSDAAKAETQNEMNSVWSEAPYRMTDKEREEFLKERNHLDESI